MFSGLFLLVVPISLADVPFELVNLFVYPVLTPFSLNIRTLPNTISFISLVCVWFDISLTHGRLAYSAILSWLVILLFLITYFLVLE